MKKRILSIAIFGFVLFAFACGDKSEVKQNESEQTPAVANTVNSNSSLPQVSQANTNAAISTSDANDKTAINVNAIRTANSNNTANSDTDDLRHSNANQKHLDRDDIKGKSDKDDHNRLKIHRDSDDKDKHHSDDDNEDK